MSATPRPAILSATVRDGDVVVMADGVPVLAMSVKHALHLVARMASAIAEAAR